MACQVRRGTREGGFKKKGKGKSKQHPVVRARSLCLSLLCSKNEVVANPRTVNASPPPRFSAARMSAIGDEEAERQADFGILATTSPGFKSTFANTPHPSAGAPPASPSSPTATPGPRYSMRSLLHQTPTSLNHASSDSDIARGLCQKTRQKKCKSRQIFFSVKTHKGTQRTERRSPPSSLSDHPSNAFCAYCHDHIHN